MQSAARLLSNCKLQLVFGFSLGWLLSVTQIPGCLPLLRMAAVFVHGRLRGGSMLDAFDI